MAFVSLHHWIDLDWLKEAWRQTRKDGAPGIDGQTAEQYEANLEMNLQGLLERFRTGRYKAPPVRRTYIPKGNGETRPIGIPTLEDKILQRAIVMLMEPIYEVDFDDDSYGFRKGRGAHDACQAVRETVKQYGGGWVLEVDFRRFFDMLDHEHIRNLVAIRMRDGVIRRHIGKWLKAGVMEDGRVSYPDAGSPQGGVISPMLANIYLHYALDRWFNEEVKSKLNGRVRLIRYADDFVIVFSDEHSAQLVMSMLSEQVSQYGLTIHPGKTRLIDFRHPQHSSRRRGESGGPGTFDLLGFTFYWAKSHYGKARGTWFVKSKTMSSRLTRAIKSVYQWCRKQMHRPVREQWQKLCQKVRGHYAYYGVPGNCPSMVSFRTAVLQAWRKWLSRRNRKREMTWERFNRLLERYPLPRPKIVSRYTRRT